MAVTIVNPDLFRPPQEAPLGSTQKILDEDMVESILQDAQMATARWTTPEDEADENILAAAQAAVDGPRQDDYGHPLDNHTRTARFWSTYLGVEITPEQVCFMNILQKISRSMNRPTRDTLVDMAGYARNVEMIAQERERRDDA